MLTAVADETEFTTTNIRDNKAFSSLSNVEFNPYLRDYNIDAAWIK